MKYSGGHLTVMLNDGDTTHGTCSMPLVIGKMSVKLGEYTIDLNTEEDKDWECISTVSSLDNCASPFGRVVVLEWSGCDYTISQLMHTLVNPLQGMSTCHCDTDNAAPQNT